jgi:tetratricopeptide (TPR) repeat protein
VNIHACGGYISAWYNYALSRNPERPPEGKLKQNVMERYMDVEARFLHADMLISKGEIAEAKSVLEGIITDEPGYGLAHNHLGWIIRGHFNDFERAEYHLKLAVKFAPDYPPGYLNYARLLMEMGEFETLKALAQKALEVKGINKAYVMYFIAVAIEMTEGAAKAVEYYKTAKDAATDEEMFNFISGEFKRVKSKLSTFSRLAFLF